MIIKKSYKFWQIKKNDYNINIENVLFFKICIMKHNLNKNYLLGLSLLSSFLVVWLINVTSWSDGATINPSSSSFSKIEHRTRLHSLYLWSNKSLTGAWMNIFTWRNNLDVINWLIIWSWWGASGTWVIWWWFGNQIYGKYSGIWWWNNNIVWSSDSFIGWWNENQTMGSDSVVVWGDGNWNYDGIILWWQNNVTNWGVVLWWEWAGVSQSSSNNSLILWWKTAKAVDWSFSWKANNSKPNSARIQANNWVRIWDVGSVLPNVPLYVNWAVKVGDSSLWTTQWEIKSDVSNGCIRWNDGWVYQTFGRASWWGVIDWTVNPCWSLDSCQFGSVFIQNGDEVQAYTAPYSSSNNCSSLKTITLKCENWELSCNWVRPCNKTYYVSCHGVNSSDPVYKKSAYVWTY